MVDERCVTNRCDDRSLNKSNLLLHADSVTLFSRAPRSEMAGAAVSGCPLNKAETLGALSKKVCGGRRGVPLRHSVGYRSVQACQGHAITLNAIIFNTSRTQ